jgi:DNA-binding TFAR19-related protein (PDSD5 family)
MDHHFTVNQVMKEILTPEAINRMIEIDFSKRKVSNEHGLSQEDQLFLKKVEQGTKKKSKAQ